MCNVYIAPMIYIAPLIYIYIYIYIYNSLLVFYNFKQNDGHLELQQQQHQFKSDWLLNRVEAKKNSINWGG